MVKVVVLLMVLESNSLPVTVAVLTSGPKVVEFTLTRMLLETLLPAVKVGILQLMMVVPVQPGAETKVTPPGKVSEISTLVAVEGPMLVTNKV